VNELEGVLGPSVTSFVEDHVGSLLTWDILVFFHRNQEAVLDLEGLSRRLGRRSEELEPEVDKLVDDAILTRAGGLIRFAPTPELRDAVDKFAEACKERRRRLALIAIVLHRIGPAGRD
jgi:hypothetical protein